jgi:hypothetical protein
MISDYCDFTMSSTFSATGQLLDVKRIGDRELARLRRRFECGSLGAKACFWLGRSMGPERCDRSERMWANELRAQTGG